MAIILLEEVLMGLDEVKASLEQALTTLDVLVEDLSPLLGERLRRRKPRGGLPRNRTRPREPGSKRRQEPELELYRSRFRGVQSAPE